MGSNAWLHSRAVRCDSVLTHATSPSLVLMGLGLLEVQHTDRFCVFGAPSSSCKVKWPATTKDTPIVQRGITEPTDPFATPRAAQNAIQPAKMASDGSAASAVSVGARNVLLEDVLLVAVHGARVDLHPASLDKACPAPCTPHRGGDEAFEVRCELGAHSVVIHAGITPLLLWLSCWNGRLGPTAHAHCAMRICRLQVTALALLHLHRAAHVSSPPGHCPMPFKIFVCC